MTSRILFKCFSLILIIVFVINSAPLAHAYAPFSPDAGGPKWRDTDISALNIYVDSSVPYNVTTFVRRARDLWNSLQIVHFSIVTDPSIAKINLTYDPTICGGWTALTVDSPEKYIISATVALGNPSCVSDSNWYTAVAVHELGHVLGLGHSRGAPSIMGEAWNKYKIPAPLYDDIIALWMLYCRGSPLATTFTSSRGNYQEWSSNINELAGYPYLLKISPGTNNYVFKGKDVDFLPLYSYMVFDYVNPHTVYRGAIGLWTSLDATDQKNRVSIVEFSKDSTSYYIVLTYTSSSNGQTVTKLFTSTQDDFSDAGFFVQLVLYYDTNYNARPLLIIYKGTDIIAYLSLDSAPTLYINPFYRSDVYVGFAVWTDSTNNPSSTYNFGPLWG